MLKQLLSDRMFPPLTLDGLERAMTSLPASGPGGDGRNATKVPDRCSRLGAKRGDSLSCRQDEQARQGHQDKLSYCLHCQTDHQEPPCSDAPCSKD